RSARPGRLPRLSLCARAGPGRVQLRLELRLLPARLPSPGARDDRLPAARWALPLRSPAALESLTGGLCSELMPTCTDTDKTHLARAVELASKGLGTVRPNPVAGAVVAREEQVLGEGWHEEFGGPHAEVKAIEACGAADLAGATLYVSL